MEWNSKCNFLKYSFIEEENIKRFIDKEFEPTHEDLIRSFNKTTGVVIKEHHYEGIKYVLSDVGGQNKERKKWRNSKIS